MGNISDEKKLKFLLILGGCIVAAIIYLLVFSFDTETDKTQEKIGFIILGDINEPGWNGSHYNGIKGACDEFGLELLVKDHIPENTGDCPRAAKELIDAGAKMVVLCSFAYAAEVEPMMKDYPNISFISTSTMASAKNLTSCFARMYQGRYMAGVLAGMRTKSNVIGYVAAFPNAEVCRGINAFTLGLHRVNPNAKVVVMWTNAWENPEIETAHAHRLVKECGADLLTYHQDDDAVGKVAESYGLDFIAYNAMLDGYSEHYLASITCSWDVYYKDILRRYLKGELLALRNAWLGVREGIISLENYSNLVTPQMQEVINSVKDELATSNNLIFYDEIYDNQGILRCGKNQVITEYELLRNINWLVKGVEVLE